MKKILGVAAAALMLSAGAASATTIGFDVTISGISLHCTLNVTQTADSKRKITNNVLLNAKSSDCAFAGEGMIANAPESTGRTGKPVYKHVAIIAGYDGYAAQYAGYNALMVVLSLNSSNDFVNGNKYLVYATTDGSTQKYIGNGTYTVGP
jgi:hypothetical protein